MRRRWVTVVLGTFLALPALFLAGPMPSRAAATPAAAEAVSATLEVERTLLKEDLGRYDKTVADRAQFAAHLSELYAALDTAVRREDDGAPAVIEDLAARIEQAESERAGLLSDARALVERIRERMHKLDLLEEQLATLQAKATEAAGPLAGRWDVVLLPANQRGTFVLAQTGTLIGGTYTLEGGWSGSLQGTLVNRKVFLERIDSKLGRSGEFEGYLSSDGSQVRGTWLRYDLSGEGSANGQWSAIRRRDAP
jgi:hypothetical protein